MYNLIIFLLGWLLKGKPRTNEVYISIPSDDTDLFDQEMSKIIDDKKWAIKNVNMLNVPGRIVAVVYCQEKYNK